VTRAQHDLAAPDCGGKRFAIVTAEFYKDLAAMLEDGARRALLQCKVSQNDVEIYRVAGCFELPIAAQRLIAADPKLDAIVALGVVIRGETPHFDYVAGECARGIMNVQLASGVPIGFGVLTTETYEQAVERAEPSKGDKGFSAALAAAHLLHVPRPVPAGTLGFRR
jgi:6,7-dimethyl-8-ribityllumazine synthase